MIRSALAALLAACFCVSASAQGDMANAQTLSLLDKMIEADLRVQSAGGNGLIKLPDGASREQFISGVNRWLNGEDPALVPSQMKAELFQLYWLADHVPRSSACFQDPDGHACEQDFQLVVEQVKNRKQDFQRDYRNASVALGLPTVPAKWATDSASSASQNTLPMPHQKALDLADSQCDDFAFSSGRKLFGDACKHANHQGFDDLMSMRTDPEIRVEFWFACQNAVGFQVSNNYLGWSQCVKFVRSSCPRSKVTTDQDYKKCLRAIQSDGWILNRAAH